MNQRPEWASGTEFEGWEQSDDPGAVERYLEDFGSFAIHKDGMLEWFTRRIDCRIPFKIPADALAVADFIAERLGGWSK